MHFTSQIGRTVKSCENGITGLAAFKKTIHRLFTTLPLYSVLFCFLHYSWKPNLHKRGQKYTLLFFLQCLKEDETQRLRTCTSLRPPNSPPSLSPPSPSRLLFLAFCFFSAVIVHGRGGGEERRRADLGRCLRIRVGQARGDKKAMRAVITDQSKRSWEISYRFSESLIMTKRKTDRGRGQLNTNYLDSHAIDFLSDLHSHKHRTHNLKESNPLCLWMLCRTCHTLALTRKYGPFSVLFWWWILLVEYFTS